MQGQETIFFILAVRGAPPFGSRRQGRPKILKPGCSIIPIVHTPLRGGPIKGQ